jgi:uncharacterized protein (TIGR00251 family)
MAATPAWPWLRIGAGSLSLQVRARPGAARRGIAGADARGLIVAVHAPAAEGRANAELIEVIAGALAVPRSAIALERGHRGRLKLIRIATADPGALAAKIELLARGPAIGENGKR